MKMAAFCNTEACSLVEVMRRLLIVLMMETVNISETSVYFYDTTQCNILEGCRPQTLQVFIRQMNYTAVIK
jgi:hypothetical protein